MPEPTTAEYDCTTLRLHFHAREVPIRISDDEVVAGWTFEGNIPAPIVHCRVGDTVEVTLTNEVAMPHSMDFHAAQVDPKVAFRSVLEGQSGTYRFSPTYAGVFLYHCGTAPVLMHMGAGMYGAVVVSPREPLPRAKEPRPTGGRRGSGMGWSSRRSRCRRCSSSRAAYCCAGRYVWPQRTSGCRRAMSSKCAPGTNPTRPRSPRCARIRWFARLLPRRRSGRVAW